jgi:hypothetical protein
MSAVAPFLIWIRPFLWGAAPPMLRIGIVSRPDTLRMGMEKFA